MATEEDWAAYRAAVVDLAPPGRAPFRIVPAEPGTTGGWPVELVPPVVVVTAWNPDGRGLTEDENMARHASLVSDLHSRHISWWPATGRDPGDDHAEEGVAVSGLSEEVALGIARDHGQAAVYVWTPGAWEVVSCTDGFRTSSGWSIERPGTDPDRAGPPEPGPVTPGPDATMPPAGVPPAAPCAGSAT